MPKSELSISAPEARAIALKAQMFGNRPTAKPGLPQVRRLAKGLSAFQVDSVNVLVRSHYMPAFSRLGNYPLDALDRLAYERRELFEYWGHAACLLPMDLFPLMRWRMNLSDSRWKGFAPTAKRYINRVLEEVEDRGPLSASELSDPGERKGAWWGWAEGKQVLEWLFWSGKVAIAGRRNWTRLYDLTERVIPKPFLDAPIPSDDDARKELLIRAARALGVATATDLAKYFYLDESWARPRINGRAAPSQLKRLVAELVEEMRLTAIKVDQWEEPAYKSRGVKLPRPIFARALVSPFDPLVWYRERASRLFNFDYKIEIYVPKPKRKYGYYVLPFLLGDQFVARIDLKADRQNNRLLVQAAHCEPGKKKNLVASELEAELRLMAEWLQLETLKVERKGDLASALAKSMK